MDDLEVIKIFIYQLKVSLLTLKWYQSNTAYILRKAEPLTLDRPWASKEAAMVFHLLPTC